LLAVTVLGQALLFNYDVLGRRFVITLVGVVAVVCIGLVKLLDAEVGDGHLRDVRGVSWLLAGIVVLGVGYALAWQIGYKTAGRDSAMAKPSGEHGIEQVLPPKPP